MDSDFAPLVRKLLRRGNFPTKKELRTKIEQFIAYFNATMAKPSRWTMGCKTSNRLSQNESLNSAQMY
jgi:hypothetical protein